MKKIISLVLLTAMLLSLISVTVFSAETNAEEKAHKHCYCGGDIEEEYHASHTDITFQRWNGQTKIAYNIQNSAFVYLAQDVVREATLTVPGGKTLTLCLNGHSITMTGNDRVININSGGRLRLCDCTRSESSKIQGGRKEHGGGVHVGGAFEMYGGIITNNLGLYGGGVYNNHNFYLYGGDIWNNKASYGGGVWNNNDASSDFIMYEGTITLNTASHGGGVWCNDGASFTMKGGHIIQNVAGGGGGGIWNNGKATMTLDGGFILENAAKWGGGIWNNGGTLLIKSGNVSRNIATTDPNGSPNGQGGGIWNNDDGLVSMTGGEITFNKAYAGGGVWCNDNSEFVMSGGVIAENEADLGGGIYIQRGEDTASPGKFRLTGRAGIIMNYSYSAGGGAYIKGILNTDGEGEITANTCLNEAYPDIASEPCAEVNNNATMPTQFIDVPYGVYYLEPLKWALENGITTGTTDVTFSPNDECSRGQAITFIYRMHGSPETDGFYFADTYPSDYFYDATRWAWELKMERSNAFSPNSSCSRQAAIRYMWIAAGSPEVSTVVPFADVPSDAIYAKAVAWALENGITTGTSDTTFSPNSKCTRAQIITLLYRAFK